MSLDIWKTKESKYIIQDKWLTVRADTCETAKGLVVDHIAPLKSDEVCGFNVPWNLKYLTRSENAIKHNKFDGTYKNEGWK